MGGDEPPRGVEVVVTPETGGQVALLVGAQERERVNGPQVALQARGRRRQPMGKGRHVGSGLCMSSSREAASPGSPSARVRASGRLRIWCRSRRIQAGGLEPADSGRWMRAGGPEPLEPAGRRVRTRGSEPSGPGRRIRTCRRRGPALRRSPTPLPRLREWTTKSSPRCGHSSSLRSAVRPENRRRGVGGGRSNARSIQLRRRNPWRMSEQSARREWTQGDPGALPA